VHRNGGKLRFRSRVGSPSGTVFSIYLPSAPPRDAAQPDPVHHQHRQAKMEAA